MRRCRRKRQLQLQHQPNYPCVRVWVWVCVNLPEMSRTAKHSLVYYHYYLMFIKHCWFSLHFKVLCSHLTVISFFGVWLRLFRREIKIIIDLAGPILALIPIWGFQQAFFIYTLSNQSILFALSISFFFSFFKSSFWEHFYHIRTKQDDDYDDDDDE